MLKIEGYVENIVFKSDNSMFSVIEVDYENTLLTVVGNLINVQQGEKIILYGEFTSHHKYGHQFKAKAFETKLPSSTNAIKKYLASGIIKGIGPTIANRIVEKLGNNCLELIQQDPSILSEIKGISPKKIDDMIKEFNQIFGIKNIMEFLSKYGITSNKSIDIWNCFGKDSIKIIKNNPYLLCQEQINIEFSIADNIAESLNFEKDDYNRISSSIDYILSHNLSNGHTCLPKQNLIQMSSKLLNIEEEKIKFIINEKIQNKKLYQLVKNREFIYLKKLYNAEIYITQRLLLLINNAPENVDNIQELIELIQNENNIIYDNIQKKAIETSINNNIMILTGRPGTGKTTTLNGIISLLEQQGNKIFLVAPTGRAAKILSKVTSKEAKTIHRLLEVTFTDDYNTVFSKNESNKLDCDVIVIDEMSMIDTILFEALLKALPTYCKIIIVGDSDQLPSIGAGNILRDLIKSNKFPTVTLSKIFRQSAKSLIITNAHAIVNGEMPDIISKNNDFFYLPCYNQDECKKLILSLCSQRLPKSYGLCPIDNIQVLTPSKKGKTGTIELNKDLQNIINHPSKNKSEYLYGNYIFRENDKVMQIKNNYNIEWIKDGKKGVGIFNGDIGIIKNIDVVSHTIEIDFEQRIVNYSLDIVSELELAYAITIHKSQGSEFDAVIVPIIGGYDKLYYRNLLYTAVTRAKKLLIILGSKDRIKFMIDNDRKMLRYTGIIHFLESNIL